MKQRVLWAVAIFATIVMPAACKKADEPTTTPNSFGTATGQYGQPGYGQPTAGQPGYGQPTYGQPTTGQPTYGQPTTGQPTTGQPTTGTPTTGQPAATGAADPFGALGGMVGAMLGGIGGAPPASGGSGGTDLISVGIQQNAQANASGMRPDGTAVRLQLSQGQTSEAQIQLQAGKCYTLVAASNPGVLEVNIKVTMPAPMQTQVLGENEPGMNPMPVVWKGNCYKSPMPMGALPVRLEVTMKSGSGMIGIQPYAK